MKSHHLKTFQMVTGNWSEIKEIVSSKELDLSMLLAAQSAANGTSDIPWCFWDIPSMDQYC